MKELKLKNTEFHIYKRKQEISFRIVLKSMHPSTDSNEIREEIETHKHIVTNIWNAK